MTRYWFLLLLLTGMVHAGQQVFDGTLHVPSFELPVSSLLSPESQRAFIRYRKDLADLAEACPYPLGTSENDLAYRKCTVENYYLPTVARHRERFDVAIQSRIFGGVPTEIITPAGGVAKENKERVLINLHGGGFTFGGRWGGQLESIPIAATGKIRVVSVDYRMAPEHTFPAASEDVAAVYKALLKDYKPENIGIYGCSAGGILTAQSVAWFLDKNLPLPGAVGMFCGAAHLLEGDSNELYIALSSVPRNWVNDHFAYFRDMDPQDPLAWPGVSDAVMARFPPSLLISSTLDNVLSSVVYTHSHLVRLGVEADLHIWEGLDHSFFYEPGLPESHEMYRVVGKFFTDHLGKQ